MVRDVSEVRFLSTPELQLNGGVYWFPRAGTLDALLAVDGLPPAVLDVSEEQGAEHPLTSVTGWFDVLWPRLVTIRVWDWGRVQTQSRWQLTKHLRCELSAPQ